MDQARTACLLSWQKADCNLRWDLSWVRYHCLFQEQTQSTNNITWRGFLRNWEAGLILGILMKIPALKHKRPGTLVQNCTAREATRPPRRCSCAADTWAAPRLRRAGSPPPPAASGRCRRAGGAGGRGHSGLQPGRCAAAPAAQPPALPHAYPRHGSPAPPGGEGGPGATRGEFLLSAGRWGRSAARLSLSLSPAGQRGQPAAFPARPLPLAGSRRQQQQVRARSSLRLPGEQRGRARPRARPAPPPARPPRFSHLPGLASLRRCRRSPASPGCRCPGEAPGPLRCRSCPGAARGSSATAERWAGRQRDGSGAAVAEPPGRAGAGICR